jgi:radical SAM protein with 4Fe4S-binding SPASM domain
LKQAYIVENGDMILCCHDWRQTVVLGNVAETSIKAVWNSDRFLDRIYAYYSGDFTNIEICRNCG